MRELIKSLIIVTTIAIAISLILIDNHLNTEKAGYLISFLVISFVLLNYKNTNLESINFTKYYLNNKRKIQFLQITFSLTLLSYLYSTQNIKMAALFAFITIITSLTLKKLPNTIN